MKPKMRAFTYIDRYEDFVVIRTNKGQSKIDGNGIADWIERLLPVLDGKVELSEIESGLDEQRVAMVRKVVHALIEAGAVYDASLDENWRGDEAEEYSSSLAYLEMFVDTPWKVLNSIASKTVTVVGDRDSDLEAIKESLLSWGIGSVKAFHYRESNALCDGLVEGDFGGQSHGDMEDGKRLLGDQSDALMVIDDVYGGEASAAVAGSAIQAGIPVIMCGRLGDTNYIGPIVTSDEDPCFECARLRLGIWHQVSEDRVHRGYFERDVVGSIAANWVFRYLAEIPAPIAGTDIVTLEHRSLTRKTHRLASDWRCSRHGNTDPDDDGAQTRKDQEPTCQENSAEHSRSWVDSQVGYIAKMSTSLADQFPVPQVVARIANTKRHSGYDDVKVPATSVDDLEPVATTIGLTAYSARQHSESVSRGNSQGGFCSDQELCVVSGAFGKDEAIETALYGIHRNVQQQLLNEGSHSGVDYHGPMSPVAHRIMQIVEITFGQKIALSLLPPVSSLPGVGVIARFEHSDGWVLSHLVVDGAVGPAVDGALMLMCQDLLGDSEDALNLSKWMLKNPDIALRVLGETSAGNERIDYVSIPQVSVELLRVDDELQRKGFVLTKARFTKM